MDENSSDTHKVFLRAVEHYSTSQMTASFVIVAYWMNFSLELGAKKNKQCRMLGGNLLVKNTTLLYLLFLLKLLLLLPAG